MFISYLQGLNHYNTCATYFLTPYIPLWGTIGRTTQLGIPGARRCLVWRYLCTFTVFAKPAFVFLPWHCLAWNSPIDVVVPEDKVGDDDEDKKQRQYGTGVSLSGYLVSTVRVAVTIAILAVLCGTVRVSYFCFSPLSSLLSLSCSQFVFCFLKPSLQINSSVGVAYSSLPSFVLSFTERHSKWQHTQTRDHSTGFENGRHGASRRD